MKTNFTYEDIINVSEIILMAWCKEETNIPDDNVRDATRYLRTKAIDLAQNLLDEIEIPSLELFK